MTLTVIPTDGITDAGPAIQELYDTGGRWDAPPGAAYLLNTPVFLDRSGQYGVWPVELNGARIILGPALPTTAAFYRDPATQWAFFSNTKRAARVGSKVTVTADTRATLGAGALMPLVMRNGTVVGNGANRGLVFGNRCGHTLERMILSGARTLLSWFDYADIQRVLAPHVRRDTDCPGSAAVIGINPGDGLEITAGKADGGKLLADLTNCHGVTINNTVTGGLKFTRSSGIVINGIHQETGIAGIAGIDLVDSSVLVNGGVVYPPEVDGVGAITITDAGAGSHLVMNALELHRTIDPDNVNRTKGALLRFAKSRPATTVHVNQHFATDVTIGGNGGWERGESGLVISDGPLIKAALAAGADALASGTYSIRNTDAGWVCS